MKSSFFCMVSLVGFLYAENLPEVELLAAIKNRDERTVFEIRVMQNNTFNEGIQERLLSVSQESVSQSEKSISLLKSGRDVVVLGGGLISLVAGRLSLLYAFTARFLAAELIEIEKKQGNGNPPTPEQFEQFAAPVLMISGLALLGLGCSFVKRGWTCKAALHSLKKAKRIQKLIEKVAVCEIEI